ncbi:MAG: hypothetical protein NW226_22885 [Microscillaceae bacterium]|nr:hypothetical protein [Microscillaceae bacterium]
MLYLYTQHAQNNKNGHALLDGASPKKNTDEVFNPKRSGETIIVLTLLGSIAYATLRYNVLKGVPWFDWPVYVLNKAFAFSSLLLLGISLFRYRFFPTYSNAKLMYMAGITGTIHVLLSLLILNPTYYEKFFYQGKLTISAGFSMLLGAIAFGMFVSGKNNHTNNKLQNLIILALLVGLHAGLQGFLSWFLPHTWPGGLPPITLLSSLASLTVITTWINLKKKQHSITKPGIK